MGVRGTVTALEEAGALATKALEDEDEPVVHADTTPVEEREGVKSEGGFSALASLQHQILEALLPWDFWYRLPY